MRIIYAECRLKALKVLIKEPSALNLSGKEVE